jgi:hypothetical protein
VVASGSLSSGGEGQIPVLVELLRPIPHLSSEEPEAIMRLFIRLDEVHGLGLVEDRVFITRILSLVSGSLLTFLGSCLRTGSSWVDCKSQLLSEYFPHFVHERMIQDLVIFHFQGEGQPLRAYIEQVFAAAKFLRYAVREQELVDHVVMNFHPSVLNHAAFVDRPRPLKELYQVVGIIEEKLAVAQERQRLQLLSTNTHNPRSATRSGPVRAVSSLKCQNCSATGHIRRDCPQRTPSPGKRAGTRRPACPRAKILSGLKRVAAVPMDPLLWVVLELKTGKVPVLVDTGAQFSCVRADVAEFLYLVGEPSTFAACSVSCVLDDGQRCQVTNAMTLHVKLLSFSWGHEFKVLNGGPFPVILGIDFLRHTNMLVNPAAKTFFFNFAPDKVGNFSENIRGVKSQPFLQGLFDETPATMGEQGFWPEGVNAQSIMSEFPGLFSSAVGTALVSPFEIKLTDILPVRSPPYQCAPPKLEIFQGIVNELLEQGVVRLSKSLYASPAFLVPKSGDAFCMVVDYRKVNAKIVFDSYPMPTIDQAFEQLGGAVVFSVFDLNSAYFQIPLSVRSQHVTAFRKPFGLFEFNKLPMGISVGSQGLSSVIDELFADLKGKCVFNFLDELVVYSPSMEEHTSHMRQVLCRLQDAGFTLNSDKVTLGATEIKYLGHLISPRGISVFCLRGM